MTANAPVWLSLLGLLAILFVGLVVLAAFVFWIWMLIHAIRNKGLTDMERLMWVVVVLFLHFLGALLYFFIGRTKEFEPVNA